MYTNHALTPLASPGNGYFQLETPDQRLGGPESDFLSIRVPPSALSIQSFFSVDERFFQILRTFGVFSLLVIEGAIKPLQARQKNIKKSAAGKP